MTEGKSKSLSLFEVIYIVLLAALLVMAALYMSQPRIGVLDAARVAKEVGLDARMAADDKEWTAAAQADLAKIKGGFETQTKGLKEKAEKGSDTEQSAAKEAYSTAARGLYEQSAEAKTRLLRHRQQVLATYRTRLQPFITQVARRKRLWVVLDESARVFYANKRVDITDDVIHRSKDFFEKEPTLIDENLFQGKAAAAPAEVGADAAKEETPAAGE